MKNRTKEKLDELYDAIANGDPCMTHSQALAWVYQAHEFIHGRTNAPPLLHKQRSIGIPQKQNPKANS